MVYKEFKYLLSVYDVPGPMLVFVFINNLKNNNNKQCDDNYNFMMSHISMFDRTFINSL